MDNVVPLRRRSQPVSPTRRPTPARTAPEPLWREAIGTQLRQERRTRGERIADVAGRAGVSPQYLSEVERGRKEASSEVLGALCDALDVPLSTVVGAAGQEIAAELAELARAERVAAVRELRSRPASAMSLAPAPTRSAMSGQAPAQPLCLAA